MGIFISPETIELKDGYTAQVRALNNGQYEKAKRASTDKALALAKSYDKELLASIDTLDIDDDTKRAAVEAKQDEALCGALDPDTVIKYGFVSVIDPEGVATPVSPEIVERLERPVYEMIAKAIYRRSHVEGDRSPLSSE